MDPRTIQAFRSELEAMKEAGVLGDVLQSAKKVLTTPIPGTPEIFPSKALEEATRHATPTVTAPLTKAVPKDWRAARQAAFRG